MNILVTNNDDWEALYIDGKLFTQDHEIKRNVLRKVKGKLYGQDISNEYTYDCGYLPDNYEDIPKDVFDSEIYDMDEE